MWYSVYKKKLSSTEFEVMKVVWANSPPITTNMIMEKLGRNKNWKLPTILTLMTRLVEKGYLSTRKEGKERTYYALIPKEEYLSFETQNFVKNYHENSLSNFVDVFYSEKANTNEIDAVIKHLESLKERLL